MSPPLTAKSPARTTLALLIVVVPVVEPIPIVVAAPAKLTVVAVAFTKLKVPAVVVVMSPPLTAKSPSRTTLAFLIVAVPLAAPILRVEAAPAKLTVVAVELTKLKVP